MLCQLCKREVDNTTRHHLIPKTTHSKKRIKRDIAPENLRETINVCSSCCSHIHAVISEKDMSLTYNTLESLENHPEVAKFLCWIKKKPGHIQITAKQAGGKFLITR